MGRFDEEMRARAQTLRDELLSEVENKNDPRYLLPSQSAEPEEEGAASEAVDADVAAFLSLAREIYASESRPSATLNGTEPTDKFVERLRGQVVEAGGPSSWLAKGVLFQHFAEAETEGKVIFWSDNQDAIQSREIATRALALTLIEEMHNYGESVSPVVTVHAMDQLVEVLKKNGLAAVDGPRTLINSGRTAHRRVKMNQGQIEVVAPQRGPNDLVFVATTKGEIVGRNPFTGNWIVIPFETT